MADSTAAARTEIVVESKVLGPLEVPATQIYSFPHPLYGFPDARSFALVPAARDGFFWMQSLDFDALTFLLVDPFLFVEGYSVEVGPDDLGELHSEDPADILVLSILTLPRDREDDATVNLQGPVVLNLVERLGRQVVLESPFGLRHPIDVRSSG